MGQFTEKKSNREILRPLTNVPTKHFSDLSLKIQTLLCKLKNSTQLY